MIDISLIKTMINFIDDAIKKEEKMMKKNSRIYVCYLKVKRANLDD
jgi:hypothetical protein